MKPNQLTARQGKILRYLVHSEKAVGAETFVMKMWMPTDFPTNLFQAKAALNQLVDYELAERTGKCYQATKKGSKLISQADKDKIWNVTEKTV